MIIDIMKKRSRPKIEPWGMPLVTFCQVETPFLKYFFAFFLEESPESISELPPDTNLQEQYQRLLKNLSKYTHGQS